MGFGKGGRGPRSLASFAKPFFCSEKFKPQGSKCRVRSAHQYGGRGRPPYRPFHVLRVGPRSMKNCSQVPAGEPVWGAKLGFINDPANPVMIRSCAQTGNFRRCRSQIFFMVGGTGVSPVQAQAEACGYKKFLCDCLPVSPSFCQAELGPQVRSQAGAWERAEWSGSIYYVYKQFLDLLWF